MSDAQRDGALVFRNICNLGLCYLKNQTKLLLSNISSMAKIPVVNKFHSKLFFLLVSLDVCRETQIGQSMM